MIICKNGCGDVVCGQIECPRLLCTDWRGSRHRAITERLQHHGTGRLYVELGRYRPR